MLICASFVMCQAAGGSLSVDWATTYDKSRDMYIAGTVLGCFGLLLAFFACGKAQVSGMSNNVQNVSAKYELDSKVTVVDPVVTAVDIENGRRL